MNFMKNYLITLMMLLTGAAYASQQLTQEQIIALLALQQSQQQQAFPMMAALYAPPMPQLGAGMPYMPQAPLHPMQAQMYMPMDLASIQAGLQHQLALQAQLIQVNAELAALQAQPLAVAAHADNQLQSIAQAPQNLGNFAALPAQAPSEQIQLAAAQAAVGAYQQAWEQHASQAELEQAEQAEQFLGQAIGYQPAEEDSAGAGAGASSGDALLRAAQESVGAGAPLRQGYTGHAGAGAGSGSGVPSKKRKKAIETASDAVFRFEKVAGGFKCRGWHGRQTSCRKVYAKKSALKRHIRSESGIKEHACTYPKCRQSFADKSTLDRHTRIHTGEKPFTCKIPGCGKSFADRTNARRHEKTHLPPAHECRQTHYGEYCGVRFTRKQFLQNHQTKALDPANKQYVFSTINKRKLQESQDAASQGPAKRARLQAPQGAGSGAGAGSGSGSPRQDFEGHAAGAAAAQQAAAILGAGAGAGSAGSSQHHPQMLQSAWSHEFAPESTQAPQIGAGSGAAPLLNDISDEDGDEDLPQSKR